MTVVFNKQLPGGLGELSLRPPTTAAEYDLVWRWWNARHVRGRWSVEFRLGPPDPDYGCHTREQLELYLRGLEEKQLDTEGHQPRALLGAVDGVDMCYLEVYGVGSSPLLGRAGLTADDRGMHLIIGSIAHLGRGLAEAIGLCIVDWQFETHPAARRFVIDPAAGNALAIKVAKTAARGALKEHRERLPHKLASLLTLERKAFERLAAAIAL